ncbi:MAG: hypothetical protein U0166_04890 [Acidobacteriota bacterium]
METFACDRCGREVERDAARYRAVVEIAHDADTLVITDEDLERDHAAEIRSLLTQMTSRDPKELEEQVYVKRALRLCAPCRRVLLSACEPIARRAPQDRPVTDPSTRPPSRRRGRRRPRPR